MVNRRKENRLVEKNPIYIKPGKDADKATGINAYTYDISLGGARIHTGEFFDVGSIIRIQMELAKTNQSIVVDGQVRWIKPNEDDDSYELGVEFQHHVSQTVLSLIRHIYSRDARIPSSVA